MKKTHHFAVRQEEICDALCNAEADSEVWFARKKSPQSHCFHTDRLAYHVYRKNIQARSQTDNAFLRLLYKTFNNSLFGKLLERLDKRTQIKLVKSWEKSARKAVSSPQFKRVSIYDDNLAAVEMKKFVIL